MVSYGNTPTTTATESREAMEQREGRVARAIERRTSRLPSDLFLWAAGASILGSLAAQFMGTRKTTRAPLATFVGMWAPTLLILGLYNKVVKIAGSDRMSR